jgi:3-oxoacyl-(acyl-carrier-protein) synthase
MKLHRSFFFIGILLVAIAGIILLYPGQALTASTEEDLAERISVQNAYQQVTSGKAILVCAYGKEECKDIMLDGAITLKALEEKLPELKKDQPIIFYCG